jgi:hypothetical protein
VRTDQRTNNQIAQYGWHIDAPKHHDRYDGGRQQNQYDWQGGVRGHLVTINSGQSLTVQ